MFSVMFLNVCLGPMNNRLFFGLRDSAADFLCVAGKHPRSRRRGPGATRTEGADWTALEFYFNFIIV